MYPLTIQEEELKSKVAHDIFKHFDCTRYINNIDFCVDSKNKRTFLWAEAKRGKSDVSKSFVQLILTIGKAKLFASANILPPKYLGAFDCEQIAFLEYSKISDIFQIMDFNWNVTPSNHNSKEFQILLARLDSVLNENYKFTFENPALNEFIKNNFVNSESTTKIQITRDNYLDIYFKWREIVMPTISIDWSEANKSNIREADFYIADLISKDNESIEENLKAVLRRDYYELSVDKKDNLFQKFRFKDNQKAHKEFWSIYERPPKEQFWAEILDRRDLLMSYDIRERKGSFYTPRAWVSKSQEYLRAVFENLDEEYFIWDCAAGSGNLLFGLKNKFNIFASTLDNADVDIMREKVAKTQINLLDSHIFQFDFLNDEFKSQKNGGKIPDSLMDILNSQSKRKKLIIYINPPYAEAASATQVTRTGKNKDGVARNNKTHEKYKNLIRKASNELFAQFFIRIYSEIKDCNLASFSTLKYVNSSNFIEFRKVFQATFLKGFMCPAFTFDNVKGSFPIGFLIWNLSESKKRQISLDIFDSDSNNIGKKSFYSTLDKRMSINQWIKQYDNKNAIIFGYMGNPAPDFQHNKFLCIINNHGTRHNNYLAISASNLFPACIYFSIRHAIPHTWINHNDQFLSPNEKWLSDKEFQGDCLAFTLFHAKNRIVSKGNLNHFIPFSEAEIGAKDNFASHFMHDFINGKCAQDSLSDSFIPKSPINFSKEARAVLKSAKKLFEYYHAQDIKKYNPNASLYEIKEFFQGRDSKGKMNPPQICANEKYKELLADLKYQLDILAHKIESKIYEYGFLET